MWLFVRFLLGHPLVELLDDNVLESALFYTQRMKFCPTTKLKGKILLPFWQILQQVLPFSDDLMIIGFERGRLGTTKAT